MAMSKMTRLGLSSIQVLQSLGCANTDSPCMEWAILASDDSISRIYTRNMKPIEEMGKFKTVVVDPPWPKGCRHLGFKTGGMWDYRILTRYTHDQGHGWI